MFHGISIVVQVSTARQSSEKSFLMPLSLVCDTKKKWVQVCKANMKDFASIDIDQVKNILFVDKIQKELVALVVLHCINHLDITLYHCFM